MAYVNVKNFFYICSLVRSHEYVTLQFFFLHAMFHSIGKNNHHVMETMLTEDSISLLLHGVVNLFPLVQVSSLNQVNSVNLSSIRFRISISDNLHKHELLLPIIYSTLVENGQLK